MTHAPEPWTLDTGVVHSTDPDPERWIQVRSSLRELILYDSARGDAGNHCLEDLTRIVACVNFLQGIPTEVLEKFKDRPVRSRFAALHCCVVLLNQLP